MKYNIGDYIEFRTGFLKPNKYGTIVEIDYNQLCVDCDNSDCWITEEDIVKIIKPVL